MDKWLVLAFDTNLGDSGVQDYETINHIFVGTKEEATKEFEKLIAEGDSGTVCATLCRVSSLATTNYSVEDFPE